MTTTVDEKGRTVYRVDAGHDLDQYLYRGASPLNFAIDVSDSYGPVTAQGAPAPGNSLYGKDGLLTLRVYDVDEAAGEIDHVYVNGVKLDGQLSGADGQWATDTFIVPTRLLRLPTPANPAGTNDFSIDIDVANAGWAVQVDWAELRPAGVDSQVRPAVFVHGITGNAGPNGESSMSAFKNYIVAKQPGLQGRAIAPPLTKNGSISANASKLAGSVDKLLEQEPIKQIDIVAHSMGGLNSRLYAFDHPGRVRTLVMVATPNGGSRLADIVCASEKRTWYSRGPADVAIDHFTNDFGECNNTDAGIYQLQQGYVQDVFNKQVPDLPSVNYATIAGQGNALGNIALDGEDDGTVSVSSVRYLDKTNPDHPGLHTSLLPAYEESHSGLIEPGSPAYGRALCYIYPVLADCLGEKTARALPAAAGSTVEQLLAAPSGLELQHAGGPIDTVPAGSTRSYPLEVPAGTSATLILRKESDDLDAAITNATLSPTTMFALPASAAEFTGPQTLTVTNSSPAPLSFFGFLLVSSNRSMTVDAPAIVRPGTSLTIRATLAGPLPGDSPQFALTDSSGQTVNTGPLVPAGEGLWTVEVPLPATAGSYSATVWVEGAQPRSATAPVIAAAGGSIDNGFQQIVGDDDNDGLIDWLDVIVPVRAAEAGDYRLAAQLMDATGSPVSTAGTTSSLGAGNGSMTLRFTGESIYDSQAAGPWHLGDVILSDADLTPLDLVRDLGEVTPDDYRNFEHDLISVSGFSDSGVDSDADNRFDALNIGLDLQVESPGSYDINAKLVSPDGSEVGRTQQSTILSTGVTRVTLAFDGASIGKTGHHGPFVLRDLAIYPSAAPSSGLTLVDAYETKAYRNSDFAGGGIDLVPTADFSASTHDLDVEVDASGSTDDTGIVAYSWTFGDGTTGAGVKARHTYAEAGTYPVTLVVTDGAGQSDSMSKSVTVATDRPPNAKFTLTTAGRTVSVDASPSTDDNGIASFGWDFGDGTTGTGATAQHTYGAAGTYRISLVVTDAATQAASTHQDVTITDSLTCAGKTATIVATGGIVRGTDGPDVIIGSGQRDVIYAAGGGDVICAGGGDDVIFAGAGADRVYSGAGRDTVYSGAGNDAAYGGSGSDLLYGAKGDDRLYGQGGDDRIYGQAGDDLLVGGLGRDILIGGSGRDRIRR